ncbi:MAG TPA: hypothetical protein VK483_14070 [Chitinophagaceae bacterium]|nr:hypothetical protein [Chitinophagaceae bacterium]
MVRNKVKTGQHIARLKWTKGNISFTSVCVTDENTVVYDNMLSNTAYMDHHSVCFDYRIGTFWQTKYEDMDFGAIKAELKIRCINGTPICDHQCDAQIDLGEAKISCKVETIGNCCKLSWVYGWATGLKSVKLSVNEFGVEITGVLGSSGSGDGSCTECCPPISTTMIPVQTDGGSVADDGPQQIRTLSVKTIEGEVVDVKVPNNIRPGDHISGSVAKNIVKKRPSDTLDGAVIDINGQQHQLRGKNFTFLVPSGAASIPFIIKNSKGESIGTTQIPINTLAIPQLPAGTSIPPQQIEMPPPHSPGNFVPVNYCQPGQPLTINGNFDGNAANTKVSINTIPCEVLAESDRGSFVNVPSNLPAGKASITIKEGGVTKTMPIQVITTDLKANKKIVQRGTKATVTATVKGLENLDLNNNNFKIELTNGSPGVIQFMNPNTTTITRDINSSNVKNGVFTFTTDITGTTTGSYAVGSNVSSTTGANCWKKYQDRMDNCEAQQKKCYEDCVLTGKKDIELLVCYEGCNTALKFCVLAGWNDYLDCLRKIFGY